MQQDDLPLASIVQILSSPSSSTNQLSKINQYISSRFDDDFFTEELFSFLNSKQNNFNAKVVVLSTISAVCKQLVQKQNCIGTKKLSNKNKFQNCKKLCISYIFQQQQKKLRELSLNTLLIFVDKFSVKQLYKQIHQRYIKTNNIVSFLCTICRIYQYFGNKLTQKNNLTLLLSQSFGDTIQVVQIICQNVGLIITQLQKQQNSQNKIILEQYWQYLSQFFISLSPILSISNKILNSIVPHLPIIFHIISSCLSHHLCPVSIFLSCTTFLNSIFGNMKNVKSIQQIQEYIKQLTIVLAQILLKKQADAALCGNICKCIVKIMNEYSDISLILLGNLSQLLQVLVNKFLFVNLNQNNDNINIGSLQQQLKQDRSGFAQLLENIMKTQLKDQTENNLCSQIILQLNSNSNCQNQQLLLFIISRTSIYFSVQYLLNIVHLILSNEVLSFSLSLSIFWCIDILFNLLHTFRISEQSQQVFVINLQIVNKIQFYLNLSQQNSYSLSYSEQMVLKLSQVLPTSTNPTIVIRIIKLIENGNVSSKQILQNLKQKWFEKIQSIHSQILIEVLSFYLRQLKLYQGKKQYKNEEFQFQFQNEETEQKQGQQQRQSLIEILSEIVCLAVQKIQNENLIQVLMNSLKISANQQLISLVSSNMQQIIEEHMLILNQIIHKICLLNLNSNQIQNIKKQLLLIVSFSLQSFQNPNPLQSPTLPETSICIMTNALFLLHFIKTQQFEITSLAKSPFEQLSRLLKQNYTYTYKCRQFALESLQLFIILTIISQQELERIYFWAIQNDIKMVLIILSVYEINTLYIQIGQKIIKSQIWNEGNQMNKYIKKGIEKVFEKCDQNLKDEINKKMIQYSAINENNNLIQINSKVQMLRNQKAKKTLKMINLRDINN